jgi:hypothetical protein
MTAIAKLRGTQLYIKVGNGATRRRCSRIRA